MAKEGRQCPECQTTLKLVLLSDLVGGSKITDEGARELQKALPRLSFSETT